MARVHESIAKAAGIRCTTETRPCFPLQRDLVTEPCQGKVACPKIQNLIIRGMSFLPPLTNPSPPSKILFALRGEELEKQVLKRNA